MSIEYRVCWSANTNISFRGSTEWEPWGGHEETVEEVEKALHEGAAGRLTMVEEVALEASGFECWAEVREAGDE